MTQKELLAAVEALPKELQFALANSVLDRLAAEGPPPVSEQLKAELSQLVNDDYKDYTCPTTASNLNGFIRLPLMGAQARRSINFGDSRHKKGMLNFVMFLRQTSFVDSGDRAAWFDELLCDVQPSPGSTYHVVPRYRPLPKVQLIEDQWNIR